MKRYTRRSVIRALGGLALAGAIPAAPAQQAVPVSVYMSPACGCCEEWQRHMRANGFRLEVNKLGDVSPIKRKLGVPESLWSCHTAVVGNYVVEGHVPAGDVKRLLRERPGVKGLTAPGMPVGAPGMEQGRPQRYETLVFDAFGSRIFERH